MLVKSLGAWNFIVETAKADTQISQGVVKYSWLVHQWKYLPWR